jgi:dienelactone hydrolase
LDKTGYDIREHVPPRQAQKLADAANETYQACECYRDLPPAEGEFPVLVFIHGTAGFRTQSLHQNTHWASRGFVVFAADHPGIQLKDLLGLIDLIPPPSTDQSGDARGILKAAAEITSSSASFSTLAGHLDMTRVAVSGHSAGGFATNELGDVADVLVPMAGGAPMQKSTDRVKSTLVLSAQKDGVAGDQRSSYTKSTESPKRFADVADLGHLFCSDLCWIGADAGGIVQIAEDHGISVAGLFAGLGTDGCAYLNEQKGTTFLQPECGWTFTNYASAAVLEETLRCDTSMAAKIANIKTELPIPATCPSTMVYDYMEDLGSLAV